MTTYKSTLLPIFLAACVCSSAVNAGGSLSTMRGRQACTERVGSDLREGRVRSTLRALRCPSDYIYVPSDPISPLNRAEILRADPRSDEMKDFMQDTCTWYSMLESSMNGYWPTDAEIINLEESFTRRWGVNYFHAYLKATREELVERDSLQISRVDNRGRYGRFGGFRTHQGQKYGRALLDVENLIDVEWVYRGTLTGLQITYGESVVRNAHELGIIRGFFEVLRCELTSTLPRIPVQPIRDYPDLAPKRPTPPPPSDSPPMMPVSGRATRGGYAYVGVPSAVPGERVTRGGDVYRAQ